MKLDETKRRGPTSRPISFKPNAEASNGKWVKPFEGRKRGQGKWQNFEVDRGLSLTYHKEFQTDRRTSHISENYKGKKSHDKVLVRKGTEKEESIKGCWGKGKSLIQHQCACKKEGGLKP